MVPAYGSYHLGSYDVKFDILEGNVENAFDILKRIENGMLVGEYRFHPVCCQSLGEPTHGKHRTIAAGTCGVYHPAASGKLHFLFDKGELLFFFLPHFSF